MQKKAKKILILASILCVATPIISVATYLGIKEKNAHIINNYRNFINNTINNNDSSLEINANFIKGADVSSYADVIENFLFEKNIKKSDNEWYSYKDIQDTKNTIWDSNTNSEVTLLDYINNNLFSYFDSNSNRVYANMFEILRLKGFNSLRLKLWVDPYDSNGNSYGGGHNDLATTIFIINEAKKYGFNDFLLDFHYSDFWSDPSKQHIPKSWVGLSEQELIQKGYDYTFNTLKTIYEETGIIINRVQYGNEINYGLLWPENQFRPNNFEFSNKFIISAIRATQDFEKYIKNNFSHDINIDKSLHLTVGAQLETCLNEYRESIYLCDTIQISSYIIYRSTFDDLYETLLLVHKYYPNKKIVLGETSIPYSSSDYGYLNDGSAGEINRNKPDNVNYSPEIQSLILFQYMQLLSKMFPNFETGFYWWEIGYLYIGRSSWATKEGMEYLPFLNKKNTFDMSNWGSLTGFDRNGIALPMLDVVKNFNRQWRDNNVIYRPNEIINIIDDSDTKQNIYYKNINFLYPFDSNKFDLSKICFNLSNNNANDLDIDVNIHINKYDYSKYLNNYNYFEILKQIVIKEIQSEFDSIMYDQVNFLNFTYDSESKIGEITICAKDNSFYYVGSNTFKFKIHDTYYSKTIDLTNTSINIDKKSNSWFKVIINFLNNQDGWAFGKQIYEYFGIEGGANDNNEIWLWDPNKYVNRNPEYFLLTNDAIRMYNNKVDFDVLNQNKFWIDNFSKYSNGEHIIYFAIKKGQNNIDWDYDIKSTFSQVGKESWKYVDLLVYKIKINLY